MGETSQGQEDGLLVHTHPFTFLHLLTKNIKLCIY
jgi:hypothetical protein